MKMLLSSCLALCASVVSAESFVGADVHAQLKSAVDGARVIAQGPPTGGERAIHPIPAITAWMMKGDWEIVLFRATKADGSRLNLDYTNDQIAKGGASQADGLTMPLLLAYTQRARQSFAADGTFSQTPVQGTAPILMPNKKDEGAWDVTGPFLVYRDAAGKETRYEVLRTGALEVELKGNDGAGNSAVIRMRKVAGNGVPAAP